MKNYTANMIAYRKSAPIEALRVPKCAPFALKHNARTKECFIPCVAALVAAASASLAACGTAKPCSWWPSARSAAPQTLFHGSANNWTRAAASRAPAPLPQSAPPVPSCAKGGSARTPPCDIMSRSRVGKSA